MEKNTRFTIGKINLILIAVGFLIIVLGFVLMTGSTTGTEFNPDIFSTRRITVAPVVLFSGFIFIIFAILFKPKNKKG
jgi:NADH:ubiquinone oxidoreductase subunit 2 (subunit N)